MQIKEKLSKTLRQTRKLLLLLDDHASMLGTYGVVCCRHKNVPGMDAQQKQRDASESIVHQWLTDEVRIKPNVATSYARLFIAKYESLEALTTVQVSLEDLENLGIKQFHRKPIYRSLQFKVATSQQQIPSAEEKPSLTQDPVGIGKCIHHMSAWP